MELVSEQTNLDALVEEALIPCRRLLAETGAELRRPMPLGNAVCDRVRVREVFANLISNAIKYNDKRQRWVEIGLEDGAAPRYYVRDNGIGVSEPARERIFEIFRRLHGKDDFGGGVGAGLTIARRAVERHGGKLWVEIGSGARFDILFHIERGDTLMTLGSDKIVSVEDSDTDFMALQFALKAKGVKNPIERCASGRVAKENLLAGDNCPLNQKASLILLDLNLPEIDGRFLLLELRARDPNREVPVIVLSTSSHPHDMEVCYRAGADAYLVKPFELDDWEHKVAAIADHWLNIRRKASNGDPAAHPAVAAGRAGHARARKHRGSVSLPQLTRAIEGEIIPRLLLAYGRQRCRRSIAVTSTRPRRADV